MRVLIYGETPDAKEILEKEREAGNHASLRNPDFDLFDSKRPEPADKVVSWHAYIIQSYSEYLPNTEVEFKGQFADEDEVEEKPKKVTRAKKKS